MGQAVACGPLTTESQDQSHTINMGFVVNKVALGGVCVLVQRFTLDAVILPLLHTLSFIHLSLILYDISNLLHG
jgi:hypothetical protein